MGTGFRHVDRTRGGYFDNIFLPQIEDKIIICVMTSNAAAGSKVPIYTAEEQICTQSVV